MPEIPWWAFILAGLFMIALMWAPDVLARRRKRREREFERLLVAAYERAVRETLAEEVHCTVDELGPLGHTHAGTEKYTRWRAKIAARELLAAKPERD